MFNISFMIIILKQMTNSDFPAVKAELGFTLFLFFNEAANFVNYFITAALSSQAHSHSIPIPNTYSHTY